MPIAIGESGRHRGPASRLPDSRHLLHVQIAADDTGEEVRIEERRALRNRRNASLLHGPGVLTRRRGHNLRSLIGRIEACPELVSTPRTLQQVNLNDILTDRTLLISR